MIHLPQRSHLSRQSTSLRLRDLFLFYSFLSSLFLTSQALSSDRSSLLALSTPIVHVYPGPDDTAPIKPFYRFLGAAALQLLVRYTFTAS